MLINIKNFEVKAFEDDINVSIKVDILSSKNFNNPQITVKPN